MLAMYEYRYRYGGTLGLGYLGTAWGHWGMEQLRIAHCNFLGLQRRGIPGETGVRYRYVSIQSVEPNGTGGNEGKFEGVMEWGGNRELSLAPPVPRVRVRRSVLPVLHFPFLFPLYILSLPPPSPSVTACLPYFELFLSLFSSSLSFALIDHPRCCPLRLFLPLSALPCPALPCLALLSPTENP